jgi:hypothetical protein
MENLNKKYPIFKKTHIGFSFFCFKNERQYSLVMVADEKNATRYSYDKVTLPPERLQKLMNDQDLLDSTEQDFLEACEKYALFTDTLRDGISKMKSKPNP